MTRFCALVVAIVASAMTVVSIIDAERTGIIHYSPNIYDPSVERVARQDSPAQFSEAINITAFHTTLPAALALISIWFYRRLGS